MFFAFELNFSDVNYCETFVPLHYMFFLLKCQEKFKKSDNNFEIFESMLVSCLLSEGGRKQKKNFIAKRREHF